VVVHRSDEQ